MGINTDIFKPSYDNTIKSNIGIKGYMLLFVGIFNEVKGIEYLLGALPSVIKEVPDCKLVLIGDGDIKDKLKMLCNKLGIENHVLFLGYISQNELPKYYSSADIVILPSLNEGSPLVLPEALSCGALVIASDLPIYRKHIIDGKNGFIVPRQDSAILASKIIDILANLNKYDSVKESNRNYVARVFSWEIIGNRYKNLIENTFEI